MMRPAILLAPLAVLGLILLAGAGSRDEPSAATVPTAPPKELPTTPVTSPVVPVVPAPPVFTDADFAAHVEQLRQRVPAGFTVLIQKPFVVIGDQPPEIVKRHATSTVKWAVDKLKADFFDRDPDHILEIWLFKDEASYRKHTRDIFNDEPDTPFGYYAPRHRALIMNIATGGGTLVHEIVHPFMHANFPKCPAWFNEGLGSLFEQSAQRDGRIVGLTNWRLAGLQRAIAAKNLPSFETLTATTDAQFYTDDRGSNYAQARYLCYYLQERGLLTKFYREFHAHHADDPTGYKTLVKVLNETDMPAFQQRWEKWVSTLTFP